MENELRGVAWRAERYSFSRGWWKWDRLRQRYVTAVAGRERHSILRAVFRPLILDGMLVASNVVRATYSTFFLPPTAATRCSVRRLTVAR
ncbi:MAG: hypothetical protein CM1200mP34_1070 [Verrucomicrobiales bacterium]|nr:MAG: hypothetical protein CM1200mP34_1070 [Verrucomicrobiales bacterium]